MVPFEVAVEVAFVDAPDPVDAVDAPDPDPDPEEDFALVIYRTDTKVPL